MSGHGNQDSDYFHNRPKDAHPATVGAVPEDHAFKCRNAATAIALWIGSVQCGGPTDTERFRTFMREVQELLAASGPPMKAAPQPPIHKDTPYGPAIRLDSMMEEAGVAPITAVPVAWMPESGSPTYDRDVAASWAKHGGKVTPLYAHPPAGEQALPEGMPQGEWLDEAMKLAMLMAGLFRDAPASFPGNCLAKYDATKAALRAHLSLRIAPQVDAQQVEDAARYRFLRDTASIKTLHVFNPDDKFRLFSAGLDSAIDRARSLASAATKKGD